MTSTVVDAQRVWLRLLQPGDAELLTRFFWRLSTETVYRRFFSPITLPNEPLLKRLVDVDHCDREALIALGTGQAPAGAMTSRLSSRMIGRAGVSAAC